MVGGNMKSAESWVRLPLHYLGAVMLCECKIAEWARSRRHLPLWSSGRVTYQVLQRFPAPAD